jgi:flavin-dependent dehydrogenase
MIASDSLAYDVIIIGGGPAGASAARLLAQKGRRVVVLEKERFPRYHIGESLIPFTWFPLERIGMIDKLRASAFVKKYSVQFVGLDGKVSTPFYFTQHTDHPCAQTWQVVRDEFDAMLLDHAAEAGVTVMRQTTAKQLIEQDGTVVGVHASTADGRMIELRAPMTIDASGRDLFSVNRFGWKVPDPQLKKIAVWSYFRGAKRDPGLDEGATTVAFVPERGWFWYIPLPEDIVSVGVVAERDYLYRGPRDPEAVYQREIELQPWIMDHIRSGERVGGVHVTGDYSYRSRHCAVDGLVLAGDAFAFLDPVFSSGVFLALQSGTMAADAVDEALTAGDVSAARFERYGRELCSGIEAMRRLVYAFYDQTFSFKDLFMKYPHLRRDTTDCLIGNLFRDFDELWAGVEEFAKMPAALPHGGPLMRSAASIRS